MSKPGINRWNRKNYPNGQTPTSDKRYWKQPSCSAHFGSRKQTYDTDERPGIDVFLLTHKTLQGFLLKWTLSCLMILVSL
ncbi:unnamed protein product, partial [Allacma fusca]